MPVRGAKVLPMRTKSKPGMPKKSLSKLSLLSLDYIYLAHDLKPAGYGYRLKGMGDVEGKFVVHQEDATQFANELTALAALILVHAPDRKLS
jgi:hypothetical protein